MMQARRRLGSCLFTGVIACNSRMLSTSGTMIASTLSMPTAALSSSSSLPTMQMQRRFNADAQSDNDSVGGGTALDVAMKVNKLKRMHQSGQGQGKKEVERMAWRELNTLSEQQIATAEGKAVALLLNSWAYFARYWEKGKDGPYDASDAAASQQ